MPCDVIAITQSLWRGRFTDTTIIVPLSMAADQ